jgi:hypothetical protein
MRSQRVKGCELLISFLGWLRLVAKAERAMKCRQENAVLGHSMALRGLFERPLLGKTALFVKLF